MRGSDGMQETLFTVAKLDDFVPGDHPLRSIAGLVNEALKGLNGLFNSIYADTGRAAQRSSPSPTPGSKASNCLLAVRISRFGWLIAA